MIKKFILSCLLLCLLPLSNVAQERINIIRGNCTPEGLPRELAYDIKGSQASVFRRLEPINIKWDPEKIYRQLVILVSFCDTTFTQEDPKAYYDRLFNEPGYNDRNGAGCVADYFRDQSGGLFNLQFDVFGPYEVSDSSKTDDAKNYGRTAFMEATLMMLDENPEADYSVYDWNGNGEVNQVVFVYAGIGGNVSSPDSPGHIWPNTGSFLTITAPDGTRIQNYTCSAEMWVTSSPPLYCGLGTICHEFSHSLGLPDAYPLGGNVMSVVDEWDLMDGGNFTNYGWCPPNYSPFEKMLLGWLMPIELTEATTITDMKPISQGGEVYAVMHTDEEFYLLENRQWDAWDAGLPGKGLLIWHINFDASKWASNSINSDADVYCYDIVHADNRNYSQWCAIINSTYQNKTRMNSNILSGSPYPYIDNDSTNNALTDTSVPAALMYSLNAEGDSLLGKAITNIRMTDEGLISFDFMGTDPTYIKTISSASGTQQATYYDLQGRRIEHPKSGSLYIIKDTDGTYRKVIKTL